jgi:hypothetical protein
LFPTSKDQSLRFNRGMERERVSSSSTSLVAAEAGGDRRIEEGPLSG